MKHSLLRVAPVALAAVLALSASAFAQAQSTSAACRKNMGDLSICEVARQMAEQTSAQLIKPDAASAPAAPGETVRYTAVRAVDNEVVMQGRIMMDAATFATNLAGADKTVDQVRKDMVSAGRNIACSSDSRPFIQAGGALRMTLTFPDGSPFMDSMYDRCS